MASPAPLRTNTMGSAGNFPSITPKSSTQSVTATNGFRPSFPPKNSRVPAGDIDKYSSKMNNQNNGKSIPVVTPVSTPVAFQSASVLYPPSKGINNSQARTARKSAPSSATRADGYSTSSSGGGGKKSAPGAGGGNKDTRDREFSAFNEASISQPTIPEDPGLMHLAQQQGSLQSPPKQQLHRVKQGIRSSLDNSRTTLPKEKIMPVIPAPPSFSGPSTQVTGVKRPASPVTTPGTLSEKPKRQKIATPKAAALAKEPRMNADGSAVKRRKIRKNPEKASKGGEKAGEKAGKVRAAGAGASALHHTIPRNSGSGATVQPRPPPPYQHPAYLQRLPPQPTPQAKRDTPNHTAANSLVVSGVRSGVAGLGTTPETNRVAPNLGKQKQVSQRVSEVITISSSPMLQRIPASISQSAVYEQTEHGQQITLQEDERELRQKIPKAIHTYSGEGGFNGTKPPEDNIVEMVGPTRAKGDQTDRSITGYSPTLPEPTEVSDKFFATCIDDSITEDERVGMLVKIETFIKALAAEATQHGCVSKTSQNLGSGRYPQDHRTSSTLEKITALLKHMGVLTAEGKVITLDEWKTSGMPKFQGRFILPDYPPVWTNLRNKDSGAGLGGLQAPRTPDDSATDSIHSPDITGTSTTSSTENSPSPQAIRTTHTGAALRGIALGKKAPAGDSLQLVETILDSPELLLPGSPLPTSESPAGGSISPQSPPLRKSSSPSNQIQAEADASLVLHKPTSSALQVAAPATETGKGKRKVFATPSVQDFLKESKTNQEMQLCRMSGFSRRRQARNDPLLMRIVQLNQEEIRVKDDIDALAMKSKLEERELEKKITAARICSEASTDLAVFDPKFGDLFTSPIDWEEFRKATRELRDFQDSMRQEERTLADRATRIAEERQWLIERRKRESGSDTSPSCEASEERSLDGRGSTAPTSAPSSVSGSSAPGQELALYVGTSEGVAHPEMSIGHDLLRALIPWAMQLPETPAENVVETSNKSKKKPVRKRKHW